MNIKKIATIAGFICTVSLWSEEVNNNKSVEIGDAVTSGYLFYDGKYMNLPYKFTRHEFVCYVNENKIFFPKQLIKYLLPNRNHKVDIKSISKKIGFDDLLTTEKPWKEYIFREIDRMYELYPNNPQKHIMDLFKSIPCIKIVKPVTNDIYGLTLTNYIGETIEFGIDPPGVEKNKVNTKGNVIKIIKKNCIESIKKELKKGSCVFIFSDISQKLIISSASIKNNLPEIIGVLKSKETENVKLNKLYRLHVFKNRKFKKAQLLVENFVLNKQLEDRINGILKWREKNKFVREKIENKPTDEELSQKMIEAKDAALEEWQKNHPKEYKREQKNRKLYLEKMQYLSKKGKKYWDNHKEELEKEIDEIKKLKSQMQKSF